MATRLALNRRCSITQQKVKLGILLPTRGLLMTEKRPNDADSILKMAEVVEEAGLDSVWVGDSLTAKPRLEPLTTLAAVASRTRRVRLGTAVLLAALRHPVLLAHAVGTLDLISKGRMVLAMGVGGAFNEDQKREWLAAGVKPSRRAGRLEELVKVFKGLTRGEEVSFEERHFQLDSVAMEPNAANRGGVPILLACHIRANKEAQFRRAAQLGDGFISISESPEGFSQVLQKVQSYAEEVGRDFQTMESAFYMTVNLNKDEKAAQEEADRYIMMYYGMNIWRDVWGPFGAPEQTAQSIRQYAEAGAKTIIVRFASFDQQGQLETFIREVVPAL